MRDLKQKLDHQEQILKDVIEENTFHRFEKTQLDMHIDDLQTQLVDL